MSPTGNRRFPLNVFCSAPLGGKILLVGGALSRGPTPLRPARIAGCSNRTGKQGCENSDNKRDADASTEFHFGFLYWAGTFQLRFWVFVFINCLVSIAPWRRCQKQIRGSAHAR